MNTTKRAIRALRKLGHPTLAKQLVQAAGIKWPKHIIQALQPAMNALQKMGYKSSQLGKVQMFTRKGGEPDFNKAAKALKANDLVGERAEWDGDEKIQHWQHKKRNVYNVLVTLTLYPDNNVTISMLPV